MNVFQRSVISLDDIDRKSSVFVGVNSVIQRQVLSTMETNDAVNATLEYPNHSVMAPQPTGEQFHCGHGSLVGPLGLLVQGILALVAFSALIVKRFCEPRKERRPWVIWFFDTSKQAVGAAIIHFANVFLSELFHGDPCTWYVISFLLDSTVGLLVIYAGLKISQVIAQCRQWEQLYFGEYGSPPQCSSYIKQCGVYIIVMIIEKLVMTLLLFFNFWKEVRRLIMSPIKDPKLELVIVMFIIPFIVNAFIFWVVDNFLKKQVRKSSGHMINSRETALKYLKAMDHVRGYRKVASPGDGNESDTLLSDTLLSMEEDSACDTRGRTGPV